MTRIALKRRVFGIETEYGVTCASTDGSGANPLDADQAARLLFAPLMEKGRSSNLFLPNGGRLYLDVGSHPEYATAECDRLEDLLAQEQAGDSLLADLITQANAKLKTDGIAGTLHVFKNNLDSQGNSFGCHENYLMRRDKDFRSKVDSLVSFFVTRQILTGAGWVRHDDDGITYCLSQRAHLTDDAVSSATTRSRPIVNTRDEPHADADVYRRLHVIVGDTNVSQSATLLKVGATDMLLSCVEAGISFDDFALDNPMEAIRQITEDTSGTTKVLMADGSYKSALDIQEGILAWVEESLDPESLSAMHHKVLSLWKEGLLALRRDNQEELARNFDWAAKLVLLRRYMQRTGATLADPRVARLCLAYHDITGSGLRLAERGLLATQVDSSEVLRATEVPPATTRAHLRGRVVKTAEDNRRDVTVDWVHIRLLDGTLPTVLLHDPFLTQSPEVEAVIAEIEKHG
ncbi:MAG: Pup--protein ligase [Actinomycetaceae bacterium]|nr:Pup--protein ligase [Actinomycetaceae bacterium]